MPSAVKDSLDMAIGQTGLPKASKHPELVGKMNISLETKNKTSRQNDHKMNINRIKPVKPAVVLRGASYKRNQTSRCLFVCL